jgi:predicted enzyme related to lactoylglutathione lyase
MISGVRTTVYRVSDLTKAKDWYSQAFSTNPYFDEPYYVGFNIDGWELGLQPVEKASDGISTKQVAYWGVENIEDAIRHFQDLGSVIVEELMEVGVKVVVLSDLWHNAIGLIENPYFRLGGPDKKLMEPMDPGVTALGGIFFKSNDPEGLKKWYRENLGIRAGKYGGVFQWRKEAPHNGRGFTAWSIFEDATTYFAPSAHDHMINYRVNDLEALLKKLKGNGVEIAGEMEEYEYGKFGWILDPDGRKIELWEPFDDSYQSIADERMESR